jgi:putative hydrolase of the HAD superfamily
VLKAIIFDFDDTLADRRAALLQYLDFFANKYCGDYSPEEREALIADMEIRNNGGYCERGGFFEDTLYAFGIAYPKNSSEPVDLNRAGIELYKEYCEVFPLYTTLLEGTKEMLSLLSKNYKLGIITNGNSVMQHKKLEISGILPFLSAVVVSDDRPYKKPQKQIFELAAEELEAEMESCVYVGDHPVNDIAGALAAGMRAIRMNFGIFKNVDLRPDVPTVEELDGLLKLLSGFASNLR